MLPLLIFYWLTNIDSFTPSKYVRIQEEFGDVSFFFQYFKYKFLRGKMYAYFKLNMQINLVQYYEKEQKIDTILKLKQSNI